MTRIMPQEMEVWYLLPAIRRELSKSFIKNFKLNQKEAAEILGTSEAAISHYLKSKRASELKFNNKNKEIINKFAEKMVKDRKRTVRYLYELCIELRGCECMCKLHKKIDKNLKGECDICCKN